MQRFRWVPEDENATFRRQCVNGPEHAIVEHPGRKVEGGGWAKAL